jgi:hypothetical protein
MKLFVRCPCYLMLPDYDLHITVERQSQIRGRIVLDSCKTLSLSVCRSVLIQSSSIDSAARCFVLLQGLCIWSWRCIYIEDSQRYQSDQKRLRPALYSWMDIVLLPVKKDEHSCLIPHLRPTSLQKVGLLGVSFHSTLAHGPPATNTSLLYRNLYHETVVYLRLLFHFYLLYILDTVLFLSCS